MTVAGYSAPIVPHDEPDPGLMSVTVYNSYACFSRSGEIEIMIPTKGIYINQQRTHIC